MAKKTRKTTKKAKAPKFPQTVYSYDAYGYPSLTRDLGDIRDDSGDGTIVAVYELVGTKKLTIALE